MLSCPRGTLTSPNAVCLENLSKSLTWDWHRQIFKEKKNQLHLIVSTDRIIFIIENNHNDGCVFSFRTSILRSMWSSCFSSLRIQLNWSPNKGLQLPFTTRVCHSCSTVHRTGDVPSAYEVHSKWACKDTARSGHFLSMGKLIKTKLPCHLYILPVPLTPATWDLA